MQGTKPSDSHGASVGARAARSRNSSKIYTAFVQNFNHEILILFRIMCILNSQRGQYSPVAGSGKMLIGSELVSSAWEEM